MWKANVKTWFAISITWVTFAYADAGYSNQGTQSWTILGFREIFRGGKR